MMIRFPAYLVLFFVLPALPSTSTAQQGDKPAPAGQDPAAAKVDFQKQIWPILERSCVECHQAPHTDENGRKRRPKGKVELDSVAGINKSKKGKVVVAKKSEDSLMYQAISLPADDEDRMPPKKKSGPLDKAEIALIKQWIDEGASFGKWTSWAEAKKQAEPAEKTGDAEGAGKSDAKGGAGRGSPDRGSTGRGSAAEGGAGKGDGR